MRRGTVRRGWWWLAALAAACTQYPCDDPVTLEGQDAPHCYVDPPVTLGEGSGLKPIEHDPAVALGIYVEQLYQPFEEGDHLPIAPQSQGGVWAMPAVRTAGIDRRPVLECTLDADTGERVGHSKVQQLMYLATDGWFEVQSFPIAIRDGADDWKDVEDLIGVGVTLECTASDSEGRSATASVYLVITKG